MGRPSTQDQWLDRALAMRAEGATIKAIARALGVSLPAMSQALEGIGQSPLSCNKVVAVPDWAIRAGLAGEYRETARRQDEFAAARHCRTLVSEMRAGA